MKIMLAVTGCVFILAAGEARERLVQPQWQVAYAARYYNPPSQMKRVSHYQVYLCDRHGRHRRQVTFGTNECSQVRWVGRNAIVWMESAPGSDAYGFHQVCAIRMATLPKLKPRLLSQCKDASIVDETGYERRGAPYLLVDGTQYTVRSQGLRPGESRGVEPFESVAGWEHKGLPTVTISDERAPERSFRHRDFSESGESMVVARAGRKYVLATPGASRWFIASRDSNVCWYYSESPGSSVGANAFLSRVDWRSGKIVPIAWWVIDIDFNPNSNVLAALDGGRPMAAYGPKKHAWVRSAFIGDVRARKLRPIVKGLVDTNSVRVRP